jgi:hypothetical protein
MKERIIWGQPLPRAMRLKAHAATHPPAITSYQYPQDLAHTHTTHTYVECRHDAPHASHDQKPVLVFPPYLFMNCTALSLLQNRLSAITRGSSVPSFCSCMKREGHQSKQRVSINQSSI